ncbi:putative ribonuclease H-like domain-containing protein [Tanacetum coccineum]
MEMVLYQSPQIHKDKSRFCLQELQKKFVTKKNWTSSHQKKKIMLCMARTSREHTQDSEDEYVSIPTKEQETPSFANQQVKTPRETVKNHFTHSKNPKVDKKELGYGFTARACFVCGSLNHLIRDCDFHEKRMAKQAELNNRLNRNSTVLTRTGKILVNTARASGTKNVSTARHSFNRQAVLTSAAMKVNTVKPIVNRVRPTTIFHKTHSPFSRPFNKTTALRTNFSKQKVNTAKVNAVSAVGGKRETAVKPSAGCIWRPQRHNWYNVSKYNGGSSLRNCFTFKDPLGRLKPTQAWWMFQRAQVMTGNKAYLAEYQDFNGGPVAFGGSKGYITGKGTEDIIDAGDSEKEDESAQDCFVLPIWSSYSSTITPDLKTDEKREGPREEEQVFLDELERLKRQEKEANEEAEALRKEFAQETENLVIQAGAAKASSTNIFSTVSTPAKASSTNLVNTVSIPVSTASPHEGLSLSDPTNPEQDDSEIPPLEDIYQNSTDGIFTNSSYDDEGAVADFTNLETVVNVSPIPTSRIISSHPSTLILGDPTSAAQIRSKVNKSSGAHAFVSYVQKQRRNNHKDFQHYLPFGKKAIGTKWVYRNKKDKRGVVVRNKARLVAQGHRQEEGIDYDEVFAPMARIEAIRIFLAFASYMGFIVYQMDVKSAFLYGKIDEEVYVSQPPGFLDPKYPQKVYKVVKALYGLHQAPRAWYATLSTFLLKNGYRRGTIDKTLFIKKDKHDIILVQVYVDDIIFGSTKKSWCDEFEALMRSKFQMSSMGELTFFLGLQVKQKADGIFISQDKYVAEILKKFDFANVKTASTPIETQKPLVKDEEASDVDVHLYRSMIGSLMYLTASRPDIMFAVCACFKFQVTPKSSHLSDVKRIFRYLKGKPKLALWYPRVSSFDLESYSDSDYDGVNLDRKSATGEAEYVATASCCGQVLWIQNQMLDYGFNFMNTKIYIDNKSTICIIKNPIYHSKTKHIAIRHHFIRDAYEKKLIQVLKIHTDDNVADLLTKAFDVSRFQFLVVSIGMINP